MSSKTGILRKMKANFSSFKDIWLFIQIFLLATLLPVMLRLLSLSRLMRILTPADKTVPNHMDLEKRKDKIVKYTDYILGRHFWIYKSICLKRSLILYHFLRQLGIKVHICFGVKYNEALTDKEAKKKLEGHAWLLYKGDIFLEKNIEAAKTYQMTYCFPVDKNTI